MTPHLEKLMTIILLDRHKEKSPTPFGVCKKGALAIPSLWIKYWTSKYSCMILKLFLSTPVPSRQLCTALWPRKMHQPNDSITADRRISVACGSYGRAGQIWSGIQDGSQAGFCLFSSRSSLQTRRTYWMAGPNWSASNHLGRLWSLVQLLLSEVCEWWQERP